jgi:DNA-directed RNA polymerase specialized sigma24 family protein
MSHILARAKRLIPWTNRNILAGAGDEQLRAAGRVRKRHRESYGWALSWCARNPAEAENVPQAVYLKALEGNARLDGQASFKTCLFAVIRKTQTRLTELQWDLQEEVEKLAALINQVDEAQTLTQLDKVLSL